MKIILFPIIGCIKLVRVGILARLRVIDPLFFLWTHKFQLKGTSHDSIFQFSLFSTLADIFAVKRPLLCTELIHQSSPAEMT